VGRWFLDFVNDHHLRVKAFIYDPYQASAITDWLDNNMPEVPFITLKQGTVSLSSPTVFLRNQFIAGNIEMLADPILQTCLANAVTVANPYGIKIDRTALTSKIDCADATIDAMSQALFYFENPNHGLKED
ncbi:terminase TerL endonuclease subunit, partial [Lactococcus lactis]